ncbi:unnamed protein product, partial [Cuscuta europaea]
MNSLLPIPLLLYAMATTVFLSQGVFETRNLKAADLRVKDKEEIEPSYGFPVNARVRYPQRGERVDWTCPSWINFYQYPFEKLGLRFPFSALVSGFISLAKLSPCQIMPQTWRLLRSMEFLIEKNGLSFASEDLGFSYDLRTSGKGRFILTLKPGTKPLVLGISNANDRGWLTRFFFVERSSLSGSGDYLPDRLRVAGKPLSF